MPASAKVQLANLMSSNNQMSSGKKVSSGKDDSSRVFSGQEKGTKKSSFKETLEQYNKSNRNQSTKSTENEVEDTKANDINKDTEASDISSEKLKQLIELLKSNSSELKEKLKKMDTEALKELEASLDLILQQLNGNKQLKESDTSLLNKLLQQINGDLDQQEIEFLSQQNGDDNTLLSVLSSLVNSVDNSEIGMEELKKRLLSLEESISQKLKLRQQGVNGSGPQNSGQASEQKLDMKVNEVNNQLSNQVNSSANENSESEINNLNSSTSKDLQVDVTGEKVKLDLTEQKTQSVKSNQETIKSGNLIMNQNQADQNKQLDVLNLVKGQEQTGDGNLSLGKMMKELSAVKEGKNFQSEVKKMAAEMDTVRVVSETNFNGQKGSGTENGQSFAFLNKNGTGLAVQNGQNTVSQQLERNNLINQITQQIKRYHQTGNKQIELKLEPDFLGKVKMNLSVEGKEVSAKLLVDNIYVKNILDQNISELKNSLTKQGFNIDSFNVETDNKNSHLEEDSSSQHQFNQSQGEQEEEQGYFNNSGQFDNLNPEQMNGFFTEGSGNLVANQPLNGGRQWMINYYYHQMNYLA